MVGSRCLLCIQFPKKLPLPLWYGQRSFSSFLLLFFDPILCESYFFELFALGIFCDNAGFSGSGDGIQIHYFII